MAAEQNRRLVRQAIDEIWNGGHLEIADLIFSPDYVNHGGLIPDMVHGPEAVKVSVVLYRRAFPQFRLTVLDLFAQEQSVALRWVAHKAPDLDSANGDVNAAEGPLTGMTIGRVTDGQIVESWTCWESGSAGGALIVGDLRAMARTV